jgi:opacity protein-like surface antigen
MMLGLQLTTRVRLPHESSSSRAPSPTSMPPPARWSRSPSARQEIRVTTGQQRILADFTTKTGWTAGVGADWMFMPGWSVGVEYLHVDLGSTTLAQGVSVSGGLIFPPSQVTFQNKSDMVRAKIDWHFNPAPVVAKY